MGKVTQVTSNQGNVVNMEAYRQRYKRQEQTSEGGGAGAEPTGSTGGGNESQGEQPQTTAGPSSEGQNEQTQAPTSNAPTQGPATTPQQSSPPTSQAPPTTQQPETTPQQTQETTQEQTQQPSQPQSQPQETAGPTSEDVTSQPGTTTVTVPQSSQPPPDTTTQQPQTTTQQPSTTLFVTTSVPPETSAAPSTSYTTVPPSSSTQPQSAPTSTKTVPALVSTQEVTSDATSAILLTTTNEKGELITTTPSVITSALVTSDANGQVFTVTQIVRNPTGSLNNGQGKSGGNSFFDNTGAVVGVFVVVGIAGAAILLGLVFLFLRRRRRQKLDRDVAAAAAAANAAAMRTPFEDDEDSPGAQTSFTSSGNTQGPAMTQYGGYYASGTGPGGYDYEKQGGYDPYAAAAAGMGGAALGAGMAGAGGHGNDEGQTDPYRDQPLPNLASNQQYNPNNNGYYLDPQEYDYDRNSGSGSGGTTAHGGPFSDDNTVFTDQPIVMGQDGPYYEPNGAYGRDAYGDGGHGDAGYGGAHGFPYQLSRQESEGSVGEHAGERYNQVRGALTVANPSPGA